MQGMVDVDGAARLLLADARRALEVHGWRPARESSCDDRGWPNLLDRRRTLAEAVEHVVPMDGRSWRVALEELARRTGLSDAEHFAVDDLEHAIAAWENAPGRTLRDVLAVLS